MSLSMEKQSSSENGDNHKPPASIADQTTSEQPAEEVGSGDSTDQATTAAAIDPANEEPPEEAVSSDPNSQSVNATTDESASEQPPEEPVSGKTTKNPAAVALGRLGGLKGGRARALTLTKTERSEAARKAATARWQKTKPTK
jgi:hypothetical protein